MKLKFLSKSVEYVGTDPFETRVILGNDEGAYYPISFPKGYIDKTDGELFSLALEKIYQENFPTRAEDERFNAIGKRLAEADKMAEQALENLNEVKKSSLLAEASRSSFLKVMTLLYEKGILTDEELFETGIFDDFNDEGTNEPTNK